MNLPCRAAFAFTAASLLLTQPAFTQDATDEQFGKVHFATSCNDVAQRRFDRAMRYQHSFWYRLLRKSSRRAQGGSRCAIAYWGSRWPRPQPACPAARDNSRRAGCAREGQGVGAKTQRERDYIDALLALYTDYEKVRSSPARAGVSQGNRGVAHRYPEDDEAQIAYAIALNVAASPNDKTYANQLKGAAILEPIFKRQPRHPGVAHYLIHLYDYPPIAEKGLDAAKRYAEIAPAAPHAQHMPSHVFTRVGYWKE